MSQYIPFTPKTRSWRLARLCGIPDGSPKRGFRFEFILSQRALDDAAIAEMLRLTADLGAQRHYENELRFVINPAAGKAGDD